MNKHDIETAACVAVLIVSALVCQGCGGGKPIEIDGVNTGDPCSVCKSPQAQGPDAGDLNNGDFTNFCNSPKCQPNGPQDAADTVKESNALVHETDESPSMCDVCNRPDAQGHYAGALNDDDFIVKCVEHCPGFKHPGPAMEMATQQMNNTQGASMVIVGAAGLFLLMAFFAMKRFAAKKQTLLAGYSDDEAEAGYVRVEA